MLDWCYKCNKRTPQSWTDAGEGRYVQRCSVCGNYEHSGEPTSVSIRVLSKEEAEQEGVK